jgi:hypothetical protein
MIGQHRFAGKEQGRLRADFAAFFGQDRRRLVAAPGGFRAVRVIVPGTKTMHWVFTAC